MDRRWWGTAMVVAAILAALIVPNLAGRRIDGSASRVPIPDPPVAGQCVLSDIDGRRSALNYAQVVVAAAPVGPCGDANYGEVVAVVADHHDFPSTVMNRMRHPEPLACQPLARQYLGWEIAPATASPDPPAGVPDADPVADPGGSPGGWQPVSTGSVGLLGPSIWQYLAGQTWIACVLYPPAAPYSGTVRGGSAGPAADAFGSCQGRAEGAQQQGVSCGEAHSAETFGTASSAGADPDVLAESCRELVTTATGLTDPTAGGALVVDVVVGGSFGTTAQPDVPDNGSPVITDPIVADGGQAACVVSVVGDRHLTHSLIGVGDGPLPWT